MFKLALFAILLCLDRKVLHDIKSRCEEHLSQNHSEPLMFLSVLEARAICAMSPRGMFCNFCRQIAVPNSVGSLQRSQAGYKQVVCTSAHYCKTFNQHFQLILPGALCPSLSHDHEASESKVEDLAGRGL